ncbi:hypothetical protein BQ8420_13930 [Nocardiopsis sp. JB363]|nr:hypothetical protein BQ8420_13930 [Nocardiopsis sp. JB363]
MHGCPRTGGWGARGAVHVRHWSGTGAARHEHNGEGFTRNMRVGDLCSVRRRMSRIGR